MLSIWDETLLGRGRYARCAAPRAPDWPSPRLPGRMWARGRSLCRDSENPCVQTESCSSVSIHRTPLAVPLPDSDRPRIVLRPTPALRRRFNRPRLRRRSAARTWTQKQQTRTCTITYTPTHHDGPSVTFAYARGGWVGFAAVMSGPSSPRIVFVYPTPSHMHLDNHHHTPVSADRRICTPYCSVPASTSAHASHNLHGAHARERAHLACAIFDNCTRRVYGVHKNISMRASAPG